METNNSNTPHVLIFPLPLQGHITPMLNLSELFCLAKLNVTFLIPSQVHERLSKHTDIAARFARYPGFKLRVMPEGPPLKELVSCEGGLTGWLVDMVQNLEINGKGLLEEMVGSNVVTCLVVDGWLRFAYDVANDAGLPVVAFRCPSACCVWAYFCTPDLIQQGNVPFQDEDSDELVQKVPGTETFLRYRDLPSFCRTKDKPSCKALQQRFTEEIHRTKLAHALILNTFEELEGPVLDQLRSQCPKVYSIGPLHTHLKHKLGQEIKNRVSCNPSSSLWEVDQSCLSWLDQKPDKSVVYVGFGSLTILEKEQILEIWEGLVKSNRFFLWVIRPDLIIPGKNEPQIPASISEGTKARGCIVSWAPQDTLLAHRAIGGFLTHSGWNSTLESITAGVPMLCWPYFADQLVNSRFVGEVWKIGLDMKDTCDRNVVVTMVNDLLEGKRDELEKTVAKVSDTAKRSVSEGGSSCRNFDSLVQDIKMMSLKAVNQVLE